MKINSDVNDIIKSSRTAANVNTVKAPELKKQANTGPQKTTLQKTSRQQVDRTISDALSIAQVSQNLIQKAIIVSSKLKNIAAAGISTGNINSDEIRSAISDINLSIGKYAANTVNPVSTPTTSLDGNNIPDIGDEITSITNIAEKMSSGSGNSMETIDRVQLDLQDKSSAISQTINNLTDRLKQSDIDYVNFDIDMSTSKISQTTEMITGNPESASMAQGNLVPDRLQRLLG